jgi:glutamate-1-semialdehyde aminotransferase
MASLNFTRLARMREREEATFAKRTAHSASLRQRAAAVLPQSVPMAWMSGLYRFGPIFVSEGAGASFRDVDGNTYLDFNLCDLSVTMGFAPAPIIEATKRQVARGAQFLLPTEDSIVAAELLASRTGRPTWQFTLSASGANTEVLRIARAATGRSKMVVFGGHYHGHIDETLVKSEQGRSVPDLLGISPEAAARTEIVPFNDLEALESVLARRDVALVLMEPALTNCNIVLPQPGYLDGVRDLTRRHGTLLCFDEAHTFQFAYGGLAAAWKAASDFTVLGKGLGSGISFALYGMSAEMGAFFESHADIDIGPAGLATGGTMYASALASAVARAALEQVLVPDSYRRVAALGAALADGLEALFEQHRLPWRAFRCGPRSGYCLKPQLPRNADEAALSLDPQFVDTRRLFLANRGIWDAIASAGPQTSFVHQPADVERYLEAADEFLSEAIGDGQ